MISFFIRGYMSILLLYYLWKYYSERRLYLPRYELIVELITIGVMAGCPVVLYLQTEFNYFSLFLTIILWMEFAHNTIRRFSRHNDGPIFIIQFCCLFLAFFNSLCVHITMSHGYGLLLINQIISWTLLVISPIVPLIMTTYIEYRILSVILAMSVIYTLMGVGYEHLFMQFFIRLIQSWGSTESLRKRFTAPHVLYATFDYRMVEYCFFLLVFMMFGYFGVGNTASMNSFDPMWVRCFISVYSPYTMAGLILLKLMIPFLIVLCGFRRLVKTMEGNPDNCFLILLLFCDILVIQFLYFVKNEGSWLEIGVSLSRFIVVNITTIIIIILDQLADILATFIFMGLRRFFNRYIINPINF